VNNDCKGEIKVVGNTIGKQGSICADNHDKNKYFELNLAKFELLNALEETSITLSIIFFHNI
jgi:hypothetical protein